MGGITIELKNVTVSPTSRVVNVGDPIRYQFNIEDAKAALKPQNVLFTCSSPDIASFTSIRVENLDTGFRQYVNIGTEKLLSIGKIESMYVEFGLTSQTPDGFVVKCREPLYDEITSQSITLKSGFIDTFSNVKFQGRIPVVRLKMNVRSPNGKLVNTVYDWDDVFKGVINVNGTIERFDVQTMYVNGGHEVTFSYYPHTSLSGLPSIYMYVNDSLVSYEQRNLILSSGGLGDLKKIVATFSSKQTLSEIHIYFSDILTGTSTVEIETLNQPSSVAYVYDIMYADTAKPPLTTKIKTSDFLAWGNTTVPIERSLVTAIDLYDVETGKFDLS